MDYKPLFLKFSLSSLLILLTVNIISAFIVDNFVDRIEAIKKQGFLLNYKKETKNFLDLYKSFLKNTDDHNLPRKLRKIFNDFILKYKVEPSLLEFVKSKDKAIFNRLGKTDVSELSFRNRKELYELSYAFDNKDKVNMTVDLKKLTSINYKRDSYEVLYLLAFGILNLACMLGLIFLLKYLFKDKIKDSQKTYLPSIMHWMRQKKK